jgi:hypothetical protein
MTEVANPEGSPFVERRLGMFSIPVDWLEGMQNQHFAQVFRHFRIVRAEFDYASKNIQYVAASEFFDPVPEGTMPGNYVIAVGHGVGDEIDIRVNRC